MDKKVELLNSDKQTSDNLATTSQPLSSNENFPVRKVGKSQVDIIQEKLRNNKVFFYGFPLFVISIVFLAIFLFVLPTIQKYIEYRTAVDTIDQNLANMKTTSSNLQNVYNEEQTIDDYDTKLSSYVPTEAKLGSVLDLIQKNADDFGLQKEIGTPAQNAGSDRSTINNLAETNSDNKALFQTLSSGEIEYKPKSIGSSASAKLLSIDVTIKGTKENFLKFVTAMENEKPTVNLSYIEYTETLGSTSTEVTASLRFESYSLKLDSITNVKQPTLLKVEDSKLTSLLPVEYFVWNKQIADEFKN